jgi:hypothetical protein
MQNPMHQSPLYFKTIKKKKHNQCNIRSYASIPLGFFLYFKTNIMQDPMLQSTLH